ncbi:NTP transferase domain-containing protein [Bermanella sp. R86510]|uniref:nucleotidyltransferase family protein n=1 Tax=unclassified Bermanella TaxID=2627862 RepID=UPI0037CC43FA
MANKNNITAIVLASGYSKRFGSNKLLQPITGDETEYPMAIQSTLNVLPHVDHVMMIVRPDDHNLIDECKKLNLQIRLNEHAKNGMSQAILQGVAHTPPHHHVMICLADMPYIKADTYQHIIEQFMRNNGQLIVQPCHDDTAGHPVIFPSHYKKDLMTLQGDKGAKSIISQHPHIRIPVNDPGILIDVDRPIDILDTPLTLI